MRGSLAKIHSVRVAERGQKKRTRAQHRSSGGIARARARSLAGRARRRGDIRSCPRKSACFRAPDYSISEVRCNLNFKSANVYFCPGRFRTFVRSLSLPRPVLSAPQRFEFQIPRDHRVGRRGNNRLSSVSTRLCAVICFRRPALHTVYVAARSTVRRYLAARTFIYGATRYVSELIL